MISHHHRPIESPVQFYDDHETQTRSDKVPFSPELQPLTKQYSIFVSIQNLEKDTPRQVPLITCEVPS